MNLTTEQLELSSTLTKNAARMEYEEGKMKESIRAIASCLKSIRDSGCWKLRDDPYKSFDDYCRQRHGFSGDRASQLITGAATLLTLTEASKDNPELQTTIEALPELTVRELKKLTPAKAITVIKKIIKAKDKITPATVRAITMPEIESRRIPCPHCGQMHTPKKPSSIPD